MLADDEDGLREILSGILRRAGYVVLEAHTSDAACDAARRHGQKIDLLISDVRLPRIGGMCLFGELRRSNPDLRAVFISGDTLEEICKDAPLPNGTAFLEKPFENDAFLKTVREILG
ncbi:MAG: response regulator [Candidatus Sulfotelmatobacter sp.]